MTANLRSKLHVYGFGSNTDEEVTFTVTDVALDYAVSLPAANTGYTDNNNQFIGYIGTGTTNADLAAAPTAVFPAANA